MARDQVLVNTVPSVNVQLQYASALLRLQSLRILSRTRAAATIMVVLAYSRTRRLQQANPFPPLATD